MSTTITYEGTLPGSRIQGELIERHADGSVTVVHPDGSPWRYTVRPEHIIVDEATPTAAEPDTFRTVLLRTALDLGAGDGPTAASAPTYRELIEYVLPADWSQAQTDEFLEDNGHHLDGFGTTRLTWDEWEQAVGTYLSALEEHTAQPEPTFVDARFAGGAIQVQQDADYLGDGRAVVTLALPGHTVALFPHEARALAAALTAHAEAVEA